MNRCQLCARCDVIEKHHIIYRSQAPSLKNCKLNLIELCPKCHKTIHSKYGKQLDTKLKTRYFLKMKNIFKDDKYTLEEIKGKLDITLNEATRLCKTIYRDKGYINQDELLIALMGGKLILEVIEI